MLARSFLYAWHLWKNIPIKLLFAKTREIKAMFPMWMGTGFSAFPVLFWSHVWP
jgi:hypothetical protein